MFNPGMTEFLSIDGVEGPFCQRQAYKSHELSSVPTLPQASAIGPLCPTQEVT